MKKLVLTLTFIFIYSIALTQKVAVLQVNQTMNPKKRAIMVDYGDGYDVLKSENTPVKSEAKAIQIMIKDGWQLIQAAADPGNVSSTKYIFIKEED